MYRTRITDTTFYYLIVNENGFEEPLKAGTLEELEVERLEVEKRESLKRGGAGVSCYLVPKWEWDLDHCPLMPVDFSEKT